MAVSGIGVAYSLAGFTLLWSGVKNTTLQATLTAFLKGQAPTPGPAQNLSIGVQDNAPSSTLEPGATTGQGTTSSAIANDALAYVGHCYSYGGSPGTNGKSCWDCSSFANWVLGHDMSLAIPGIAAGGYDGSDHGPTTLSYLAWSGASTVSNSASSAEAGDLCVWQTHMGIATGGGNMVSALDESLGTKVTTISGGAPTGELLFVRRVSATTAGPTG